MLLHLFDNLHSLIIFIYLYYSKSIILKPIITTDLRLLFGNCGDEAGDGGDETGYAFFQGFHIDKPAGNDATASPVLLYSWLIANPMFKPALAVVQYIPGEVIALGVGQTDRSARLLLRIGYVSEIL